MEPLRLLAYLYLVLLVLLSAASFKLHYDYKKNSNSRFSKASMYFSLTTISLGLFIVAFLYIPPICQWIMDLLEIEFSLIILGFSIITAFFNFKYDKAQNGTTFSKLAFLCVFMVLISLVANFLLSNIKSNRDKDGMEQHRTELQSRYDKLAIEFNKVKQANDSILEGLSLASHNFDSLKFEVDTLKAVDQYKVKSLNWLGIYGRQNRKVLKETYEEIAENDSLIRTSTDILLSAQDNFFTASYLKQDSIGGLILEKASKQDSVLLGGNHVVSKINSKMDTLIGQKQLENALRTLLEELETEQKEALDQVNLNMLKEYKEIFKRSVQLIDRDSITKEMIIELLEAE